MKIKKISGLIIALVLCAFALTAKASFNPSSWEFLRPLQVPTGSDFAKVVLPEDISTNNQSFSDIRIIDQNGIEAPYLISRSISKSGDSVSGRILDKTASNGSTQFIADAGMDGSIHAQISIDASSENFKRQVSIYSSHSLIPLSGAGWSLVTDKGYIFRFTDNVTSATYGKNDVAFSPNSSRYFKVVIGGGSEGPVEVGSVTLYGDLEVSNPIYKKEVSVNVYNNPDKRSSEVTADLGNQGFLTNAISIQSSDRNFNRPVIVESSNDNANWNYITRGYISNVSTPIFEGSSTRIEYPEQNARYIRVSVVNDDNQPIKIEGSATVEGPVISAIFKLEPGAKYNLYYGNPSASLPQYDISRIASYIEENKIGVATYGAETINPAYVKPDGPVVPFTESHKFLLNILLIIVVIVIGFAVGWYLVNFIKNKNDVSGSDGFIKND